MFGGSFSGHQHPGSGAEGGASLGRSSAAGRPLSQAIRGRSGGSDAVTVPGFHMNGTNGTGKTMVFFHVFSCFFWWFCWSRTFLDSHFPGCSVFHLGQGNHSKAQIVVTRDVLRSKVAPPYRYSNYHPHPLEGFNLSSGDGSIMMKNTRQRKNQQDRSVDFRCFRTAVARLAGSRVSELSNGHRLGVVGKW